MSVVNIVYVFFVLHCISKFEDLERLILISSNSNYAGFSEDPTEINVMVDLYSF